MTGAAGQIGREVAELAIVQGHDVIAADSKRLDITDNNGLELFCQRYEPDAIINAAAYTAVDRAEIEAEKAYAVNAQALIYLSAIAVKRGIPLIHLSTDYVFDGDKSEPYNELDEACPVNTYGKSKRQGELYLEQSGANYLVLRTSWVFGRYGNNFVKTIVGLAGERDELSVIDDQLGCPTSAADVAQAVLTALPVLISDKTVSGIYHFSGDSSASWFGFARAIVDVAYSKKILARRPVLTPIDSSEYPVVACRPKNSCLNGARFLKVFGLSGSDWRAQLELVIV